MLIPVIAEIDDSLGIDPTDVEKKITPYTKAVLPVHMQGVPGRIDQIVDVANRHDLQMRIVVNASVDAIEDALLEQLVMRELRVSIPSK